MPRASIDPPSPRPFLQRPGWVSLDGVWEFAIDYGGTIADPHDVPWDTTIVVPFAPETPASGIGDTGLFRACWYRRTVAVPPFDSAQGKPSTDADSRVLLRFGAVDFKA